METVDTGKTEINYCRNKNLGGSLYPEGTDFKKRILTNIDDEEEFYQKLNERIEKKKKSNSHYVRKIKRPKYRKEGNKYSLVAMTNGMTTKGRRYEITNYVLNLILQGKSRSEIIAETGTKYELGDAGVIKYISLANKAIVEQSEEERKMIKKKNHALLLDLYQKNILREDYREARSIVEVINKMYGLNEADKLSLQGNIIRFNFDISEEDQNQIQENNPEDIPFDDITDEPQQENPDENPPPEN